MGEGRGGEGKGREGKGRGGEGRAGQGRAGQGRAGQGRAGQGRAGTYPGSRTAPRCCEGQHRRADCRVCGRAPSACSGLDPATHNTGRTYTAGHQTPINYSINQSFKLLNS